MKGIANCKSAGYFKTTRTEMSIATDVRQSLYIFGIAATVFCIITNM